MKQFIYITGSTETNIFKIGLSSNPEQRVRSICNGSNQLHNYSKIMVVDDMRVSEKSLHLKFNDRRIKGEWFKLTQGDLDWIEENAKTFCHDSFKDKLDRKLRLRLSSAEMDILESIITEIYPSREKFNMLNSLQLSQRLQLEYNSIKSFVNKLYRQGIIYLLGDDNIMINPNIFEGYKPSKHTAGIFQTFSDK